MDPTTTQENIKQRILELERNYPVDKWIINGIDIWPYIRIRLYLNMLVFSGGTSYKQSNFDVPVHRSHNFLNKIITSIKIIFALFRLPLFYFRLQKKKTLLFGTCFHRVLFNGKYFNRFYDSIIEHHNLQNNVYMMEYNKVCEPIYNKKAVIKLSKRLHDYKLLLKIKPKNRSFKDSIQLKDYNDFYEEISGLKLDIQTLKVSKNDLINWSVKMNSLKGFYSKVYKKTNPSKVVFLGYYGYDDLYAALIVANKMKINTIDFQHGPQTNIHMAYSSWSKLPHQGFNTMPREFWTWDKNSKENIESWASKTQSSRVKVVGQPYISFSIANKKLKNQESEILYSLQVEPLDQLGTKIINLIQNSEYKWNLRLHPRSISNEEELTLFLNKKGLFKNFKIQDPVTNPLPESLVHTILHVTNFSGCLIEAHLMGVPSLIINNVGKEMFADYIDNKLVYYIDENKKDFDLEFKKLIKNIKTISSKLSYSEIQNPFAD